MTNINSTLAQRGDRYGVFKDLAGISQQLKSILHKAPNWPGMEADQREALEMVVHKIARILNGDSAYDDNWVDIAGYVTLVVNRLHGKTDAGNPQQDIKTDSERYWVKFPTTAAVQVSKHETTSAFPAHL